MAHGRLQASRGSALTRSTANCACRRSLERTLPRLGRPVPHFSRSYGTLAILFGFIVMILGLLAILARSTGSTYEGIIEMPDAVPSIAGPYSIVDFF